MPRSAGRASGKPGEERRLLADDETVRRCSDLEPDAVETAAVALRNCTRQRAALTYRSLGDRHDDLVRTDGSGGERSSVEHEVGHATEQRLVFVAEWFALGAVRDDELPPAPGGDRT